MPTRSEIIESMHFDLSSLSQPFNTTDDTPYRITYEFATSQPDDLWNDYSGWAAMSNSEKSAYQVALDHVATFINVEFVEHNDTLHGTNPTWNVGQINMDGNTIGLGGLQYSAFSDGSPAGYDGFTVFDRDIDLSNASAYNLILHEIGHALGNKHPFSGANTLPAAFENNKYTVMSYDANPDTAMDSSAMQLFDILSLQDRWGQNTTTANTNSIYTNSRNDTVDSVWDTGGSDTFDASGYTTSVNLDLRQGYFSSFDTKDDVSIAFGTIIENATGGTSGDTLRGNNGKNYLDGGAGGDRIFGEKGDDILHGFSGQDTLFGGRGSDKLYGGSGNDKLLGGKGDDILHGGRGIDTFIFIEGDGQDIIRDFNADDDFLKFRFTDINTLTDLEDVANQIGNHLELDFIGIDKLTLLNTDWSDLIDATIFV
jgi:serralysin